jgi:hypothetical protein
VLKLRSTTPSQLLDQKTFKKDVYDKKSSITGRYADKLKFSFAEAKKFKLRNLSSISSSIVNKAPKSNVSLKSRNRDSSAGSNDFGIFGHSLIKESGKTRDNSKRKKYNIIKKGYETQRGKLKLSTSPEPKNKLSKKRKNLKNEHSKAAQKVNLKKQNNFKILSKIE